MIAFSGATLIPDPLNPTKTLLYVGGTAGNDTILINPAAGNGNVTVTMNGKTWGLTMLPGKSKPRDGQVMYFFDAVHLKSWMCLIDAEATKLSPSLRI